MTIDRTQPFLQRDVDGDRWLVAEGDNRFDWVVYDHEGNEVEPEDNIVFVWPGPFRAWFVDPKLGYTFEKK